MVLSLQQDASCCRWWKNFCDMIFIDGRFIRSSASSCPSKSHLFFIGTHKVLTHETKQEKLLLYSVHKPQSVIYDIRIALKNVTARVFPFIADVVWKSLHWDVECAAAIPPQDGGVNLLSHFWSNRGPCAAHEDFHSSLSKQLIIPAVRIITLKRSSEDLKIGKKEKKCLFFWL